MKFKKVIIPVFAAIVLATLFSSCKPVPRNKGTILVVGDSITWQSTAMIKSRGESQGYNVVVKSFGGTVVQDWLVTTDSLIKELKPVAVVVALGTNNSVDPSFPGFDRLNQMASYDVQVRYMLAIISKAKCSTWMEPTENHHSSSTAARTKANVNTLRNLVSKSKTQMIGWNYKLKQEPSKGAWLQPDKIHLTPVGELVYGVTIIDNTVRKCNI